jgi:hypothetical protein
VNRSFSKDAQFLINLVATVYKVVDIFNISLCSSMVEVLQNLSHVFILAHFQRSL